MAADSGVATGETLWTLWFAVCAPLMYAAVSMLFVVMLWVVLELSTMLMLRLSCVVWCECGCGDVGAREPMWVCGRIHATY